MNPHLNNSMLKATEAPQGFAISRMDWYLLCPAS